MFSLVFNIFKSNFGELNEKGRVVVNMKPDPKIYHIRHNTRSTFTAVQLFPITSVCCTQKCINKLSVYQSPYSHVQLVP